MGEPLIFEWDEAKAAANWTKHGVRFEFAQRVFSDRAVVIVDTARAVDAERREKAVGSIDGRVFTVVFVMRDEVCRLISARRASRKEMRFHGDG